MIASEVLSRVAILNVSRKFVRFVVFAILNTKAAPGLPYEAVWRTLSARLVLTACWLGLAVLTRPVADAQL